MNRNLEKYAVAVTIEKRKRRAIKIIKVVELYSLENVLQNHIEVSVGGKKIQIGDNLLGIRDYQLSRTYVGNSSFSYNIKQCFQRLHHCIMHRFFVMKDLM